MFPVILPNFDPIALQLGPIAIRWYSLAYIFGILFVFLLLKRINSREYFMSKKAMDDWLMWAVLSILLGGRLGYVLFYNFSYFLYHPLEIFFIWQGGMSFHGGLLGSIIGMWIFCRKYDVKFLKLMDVLAIAAPFGLMLGRIANFINLELYGRVTGSNYGFVFPGAGNLPRHPSQLYEAFLEGLVLFILMLILARNVQTLRKQGFLSGIFLIFYGSSRILIEFFREPDFQLGFILPHITMGQILSFPLILLGLCLVFRCHAKRNFI